MSLLKSPSWDHLVKTIEGQIKARMQEIGNKPHSSLDDAFDRNYKLGVAHGLALAVRMPTDMYNEIHRVYVDVLEEVRNESAPS